MKNSTLHSSMNNMMVPAKIFNYKFSYIFN